MKIGEKQKNLKIMLLYNNAFLKSLMETPKSNF